MHTAKIVILAVVAAFVWSTLATAAPPQTRGQSPGKRPKALGTKRSKQIPREQPLQLDAVQAYNVIDGQSVSLVSYSRTVSLYFMRQGPMPTHYRVSENATFSGASWQVFAQMQLIQYTFAQDTPGQKTLYAQLQKETNPNQTPQRTEVRSTKIEYRKPPVIQQFSVTGSSGSPPGTTYERDVTVNWTRAGNASHFYLSEQSNFSNVASPGGTVGNSTSQNGTYQLSDGFGVKTLYLKLLDRPYLGTNPGIYAESEVSTVTINYQAPPNQKIQFDETSVQDVISYAQTQGYGFTASKKAGYEGECRWRVVDAKHGMEAVLEMDDIVGLPDPDEPNLLDPDPSPNEPGPLDEDYYPLPIECTFSLFANKQLQSGWKILDIGFRPRRPIFYGACHGWQFDKKPSGNSTDPLVKVKIINKATSGLITPGCKQGLVDGNIKRVPVRELTLEGPVNEDWQQAFQP